MVSFCLPIQEQGGVKVQYRKFGSLDWMVSVLGFGCMRLPTRDGKPFSKDIIEDEAIRMIRYAIDRGVNYVDTAYPYHDGESEVIVGKALRDGYREKVKLATKSPVWLIKKAEDFDMYLNEQLGRLKTDHIDFYLFHSLYKERWSDEILKFNLLERAEAARKDGRIGHIGFSFHDNTDAFIEMIDGYDSWDFCQIQYNYMDTDYQAGTKGLRYASSKGLAVVVMEPLLGGRLANPPKPVLDIFEKYGRNRTPADLALQWVWDQKEVSLLLSGMSSMKQVEENLDSADRSKVNSLSSDELELIRRMRKKFEEGTAIPCTECNYCMPCPNNIDIPVNFKIYNDGLMHKDMLTARCLYARMDKGERAGSCIKCKVCEEKCPQKIAISEWMPKVDEELGEK